MDDIDHVLGYLRQEYGYHVWALIGHSRGTLSPENWVNLGANAVFNYVGFRDRSIPLIVNCSGRFTSELIRKKIENWYPEGLSKGYYIEKWSGPGGRVRERRTEAEEILALSRLDNKWGTALPPKP
jgi:hypothetical protein